MEDDWQLCRRHLMRTNVKITVPKEGLIPTPVGKDHRKLYRDCAVPVSLDDFDYIKRPWEHVPYMLSKRKLYECPVAIPGTEGKLDTSKIIIDGAEGPLGCKTLPCPI